MLYFCQDFFIKDMINITEGELNSVILAMSNQMQDCITFFKKDILSIRTGIASSDLVENISVEAYGQNSRIRDVASISIPDSRMIVISPWDKGLFDAIAKGIRNSDLGVNPVIESDLIRLQLPMMSTQRRDELVKILNKKVEDAKVKVRNVRRDFNNAVKKAEKDKDISQDFSKILVEKIQKTTDSWIDQLDQICKDKEKDLRKV